MSRDVHGTMAYIASVTCVICKSIYTALQRVIHAGGTGSPHL
jgi:hypothetical protein